MKISIIGTAGRKVRLKDVDVFWMLKKAEEEVYRIMKDTNFCKENIVLVSGGAAGADHIAVIMAKNLGFELQLYLPAEFNLEENRFVEGNDKWDAGRISNFYHDQFLKSAEVESLKELGQVLKLSKTTNVVKKGFKNRNNDVAKSNYVIAFTFGESEPTDGGTKDTWIKALHNGAECIHYSLKGVK